MLEWYIIQGYTQRKEREKKNMGRKGYKYVANATRRPSKTCKNTVEVKIKIKKQYKKPPNPDTKETHFNMYDLSPKPIDTNSVHQQTPKP